MLVETSPAQSPFFKTAAKKKKGGDLLLLFLSWPAED
jgi:hypothetical protein